MHLIHVSAAGEKANILSSKREKIKKLRRTCSMEKETKIPKRRATELSKESTELDNKNAEKVKTVELKTIN